MPIDQNHTGQPPAAHPLSTLVIVLCQGLLMVDAVIVTVALRTCATISASMPLP